MPRRKSAEKCKILPWLSGNADCTDKRFLQVGNSLLFNKRFQSLKDSTKMFFLCLAMESGGNREVELSSRKAAKYGFCRSTVVRCTKELIEKGFIERINPDELQFATSKYKFLFDWKGTKE